MVLELFTGKSFYYTTHAETRTSKAPMDKREQVSPLRMRQVKFGGEKDGSHQDEL
jgi:hypothetical protein